MSLPANNEELIVMIQHQIDLAAHSEQSESSRLVEGDRSQYKRGGIEALRGVVMLLTEMEKANVQDT